MKTKLKTKFAEYAALSLFIASSAFAQGAGHVGGGGEDIAFKAIRDQETQWLRRMNADRKLESALHLTSITGDELLVRYTEAVQAVGEKIVFNHDEIKFGNNVRICKNDQDLKIITCNIEQWNATRGDTRFLIVFHEYLGVAKLEVNDRDYSQYEVSPNLLGFIKRKDAFELGIDWVKVAPLDPNAQLQLDCTADPSLDSNGLTLKFKLAPKKGAKKYNDGFAELSAYVTKPKREEVVTALGRDEASLDSVDHLSFEFLLNQSTAVYNVDLFFSDYLTNEGRGNAKGTLTLLLPKKNRVITSKVECKISNPFVEGRQILDQLYRSTH